MNDIHWDSWWDHQIHGERRPPLCHSERSRGIGSFPFPVSNAYGEIVLFIRRACDFFDLFVFAARLPDVFQTPSKTVILRACDFFDLSCFRTTNRMFLEPLTNPSS